MTNEKEVVPRNVLNWGKCPVCGFEGEIVMRGAIANHYQNCGKITDAPLCLGSRIRTKPVDDSKKAFVENCLICGKPVEDYEPEMCCSGFECGCMGVPTNPCLCSKECSKALRLNGTYEQRRIAAGIEKWVEIAPETT